MEDVPAICDPNLALWLDGVEADNASLLLSLFSAGIFISTLIELLKRLFCLRLLREYRESHHFREVEVELPFL